LKFIEDYIAVALLCCSSKLWLLLTDQNENDFENREMGCWTSSIMG